MVRYNVVDYENEIFVKYNHYLDKKINNHKHNEKGKKLSSWKHEYFHDDLFEISQNIKYRDENEPIHNAKIRKEVYE